MTAFEEICNHNSRESIVLPWKSHLVSSEARFSTICWLAIELTIVFTSLLYNNFPSLPTRFVATFCTHPCHFTNVFRTQQLHNAYNNVYADCTRTYARSTWLHFPNREHVAYSIHSRDFSFSVSHLRFCEWQGTHLTPEWSPLSWEIEAMTPFRMNSVVQISPALRIVFNIYIR